MSFNNFKNINLKLKTHENNVSGFNNYELNVRCQFSEKLSDAIKKLNDYRGPNEQITKLYTINNIEIKSEYWNFQLKESITLWID